MSHSMTSFDADGRDRKSQSSTDRPIDVTDEDIHEFHLAMEAYKQQSGRLFPTWSEILEVVRSLGYEKRIWRPVSGWMPTEVRPDQNRPDVRDSLELFGWFSTVETPLGP